MSSSPRSCGACTGCCYVGGVADLQKPAYTRCDHASRKGCAIYAERPQECRAYTCLWIEGELEDGDRPDEIGLIFDLPDAVARDPIYEGIQVICAREMWPNARDTPRAATLLMQLVGTFVVRLTAHGGGTQLIGPETQVALVAERAQASG